MAQPSTRKGTYSWLGFETIPRDSVGKANGTPHWNVPYKMDLPDIFIVYGNNDSIRVVYGYTDSIGKGAFDAPLSKLFWKVKINAVNWKPKQNYDNKLFFLGTYLREGLDGLYISFYATKDWGTILQVEYTNPGNLNAVLFFSKDSINILEKDKFIIDPKDEIAEPEIAQPMQR